ncbi:hypothetical protein MNBD_ALPHA11-643 [hydrothermal vent metagenome]|uniref:Uncharacterized protein n=1 Tax=hydrothermal vent metagenome TaxID=652676 RepID=A0A3B0TW48_9ZZZZ
MIDARHAIPGCGFAVFDLVMGSKFDLALGNGPACLQSGRI